MDKGIKSWREARDKASNLDSQDPLAGFCDRFVIDDPDLIYMDGNSLGRLPVATRQRLQQVIDHEWGHRLIRGWNEGWFTLNQEIGAKIAHLIGANSDEVIVADSTSINLFKLAAAAMQARPDRRKIITDDLNFPSDVYIFQGVAGPENVEIVPSEDGIHGPVESLEAALDGDTALLSLSHVVFKSGYIYDIARLTAAAHEAGALALWDLSHSVGSIPINLNGWGADLAVGCTYKYLNAGPGAPAFMVVRRELQERLHNPISGWFAQKNQFGLDLDFDKAAGMSGFLTGTPPVIAMAAVEMGVDITAEAGMEAIRAKSLLQTALLIEMVENLLEGHGFRLNSPPDAQHRGSHVALAHDEAWRINRALIEKMRVITDFRRPDSIRFGIAPLYTSFMDVYVAMERLNQVVTQRVFAQFEREMPAVT